MDDNEKLREQGKQAIQRNRKTRRALQRMGSWDGRTASGIIVPDPEPSPEHFHIIYHVPKDAISLPHWNMVFLTVAEARAYIRDLGQKAEPRTEWYENGQVGIETPMHSRPGLWWIILEVAACVRSACVSTLRRENVKRSLVLMPGKR